MITVPSTLRMIIHWIGAPKCGALCRCLDVLLWRPRVHQSGLQLISEVYHSWGNVRPRSFEPIFERAADVEKGEVWPELWFLSDCHVTAVQHFELSKIQLTVYDPRISRLGPSQKAAKRRIEVSSIDIPQRGEYLAAWSFGRSLTPGVRLK